MVAVAKENQLEYSPSVPMWALGELRAVGLGSAAWYLRHGALITTVLEDVLEHRNGASSFLYWLQQHRADGWTSPLAVAAQKEPRFIVNLTAGEQADLASVASSAVAQGR